MTQKIFIPDDALDLRQEKLPEKSNIGEKKEETVHDFYEGKDAIAQVKNDKWFRCGKIFLYLLIFLAPLFFLPLTIVPVEINKIFLAAVLVFLSLVCYLINILLTRKIIYPGAKIVWAVFAFIAAIFLSYVFSQNKSISFYGDLIQADSLFSLVVCALAFFLAPVFFRREDFNKIGIIFAASLGLISAIGALQLTEIFIFPFDFAKQASFNTIGASFNYAIFIASGLLVVASAISELKLSFAARCILIALSLFIVAQLAAFNFQILWLETALAMLLFIAYKFTFVSENLIAAKNVSENKKYFSGIGVPLGVMILSFFFFLISPSLPQTAKAPIQIKPNLSSTLTVAKETLKGTQMFFGSGPSTFAYNFALFRPTELNQTNFWSIKFNQGFSFLSTSFATVGIIGVLAFFALIASFGLLAIKNLSDKKILIIIPGLLFLFAELFLNEAFFVQLIYIFLGLGLMLAFSCTQREISLEKLPKAKLFASFIIVIILIISGMGLFYYSARKYAAAVYYGKAMKESDFNEVLDNLDRAAALDSDSNQYLRDLSQFILLDIGNQKNKEKNSPASSADINKIIQNEIALAVQLAQRATVINPNDSLNWTNLADIYEKIMVMAGGADIFAEKNYKEAIARDPKNPYLQVSAARVLIVSFDLKKAQSSNDKKTESEQMQKLEDAKKYLEKAIELKPDYAPAHFQIAMIYFRQGKIKDAIGKLEETRNFAPFDSDLAFQLGSLYYNDGQTNKARTELERAISLNDNYSDARYILGLIYDKNGKKGKAIDQFKKILSYNQDNELIKKILKNLSEDKNALDGIKSSDNSETKDFSPYNEESKDK